MVLPILVMEESELAPWCEATELEVCSRPGRVRASSRADLVSEWRRVIPPPKRRYTKREEMPPALTERPCGAAIGSSEANDLLRESEHLARLLLRRSWRRLPRRARMALRERMHTFNIQAPVIRVPWAQTNATAWLLAAMYWNGCRHPGAIWCRPLHPATGVVRWLSGFDIVEQSECPRSIMAKLAVRVGWVESESRRLVKAMRSSKRAVALLPELLL